MVDNFTIDYEDINDIISLSPEYYREKKNKPSVSGTRLIDIVNISAITTTKRNVMLGITLDTGHSYKGIIDYEGESLSSDRIKSSKKIASAGDVIISRLRPYLKQVGYIDEDLLDKYGVKHALVSTEYYVLKKMDKLSIAFLIPFLLSDEVQQRLNNSVEGGHHPRFKDEILGDLIIPKRMLSKRNEISRKVVEFVAAYRKFENMRDLLFENSEDLPDLEES